MAHYSFRKDLAASKKGVDVAIVYFAQKYNAGIRELPKDEQTNGDFEVEADKDICGNFFVEVKFDMMAARTGNLCFEVDNGKKATGILATNANKIVYVVPNNERFKLYVFDKTTLLSYLCGTGPGPSSKFRLVRGGDNKRFGMVLVPLTTIEADKICEEIIDA